RPCRNRCRIDRISPCVVSVNECLSSQRLLQLGLVHLRTAVDALVARFVVQLLVSAAGCAAVRTLAAAARRRHVVRRGAAAFLRFAMLRTLLVAGTCGVFLRTLRAAATAAHAILDVLVLTFAFVAPFALRHVVLLDGIPGEDNQPR